MIHIVDDDADVRASTSFLLRSRGYSTELYPDGRAFLKESKMERGCVLLDLRMPHMTGLQVQEVLSERNVDLPVIILSGHGDIGSAVEAMRLGAVAFLEKPYREDDLIAAIVRASQLAAEKNDRAAIREAAAARVEKLSSDEREVLQGLVAGLSAKQTARELDLGLKAVEMHREAMLAGLGVVSLAEAVRIALDAELAPLCD